jgi:hypothetical protein
MQILSTKVGNCMHIDDYSTLRWVTINNGPPRGSLMGSYTKYIAITIIMKIIKRLKCIKCVNKKDKLNNVFSHTKVFETWLPCTLNWRHMAHPLKG